MELSFDSLFQIDLEQKFLQKIHTNSSSPEEVAIAVSLQTH